jgi:hypothetical protein
MSEKHLHIISFDVPYPPNYGGVIDVFYKIVALQKQGIKVHLHAYHYGRPESKVLSELCHSVHYYPRGKFFQAIYSSVPYIVGSRRSEDLLDILVKDDYPILFEGLHTCFYLNHPSLKHRLKIVRMHNIEWDYYNSLGKAEKNFFVKFYLYSESNKLKKFEEILKDADIVLGISLKDTEYFAGRFENVHYLPAFHPHDEVKSKVGRGDYCLYHGNLKVQENNQAALFLVKKVFEDLNIPFKIAGTSPSDMLKKEMKKAGHFELITSPYDEMMQQYIESAHINILPTFQPTGIKLKLLNALHNGRWVVVNRQMVENTGLENLCIIADSADQMKSVIKELMQHDFPQIEIERRKNLLYEKFSNAANAHKLITLVYGVPQKAAPAVLG